MDQRRWLSTLVCWAVVFFPSAAPACAEIQLQKIQWQFSRSVDKKPKNAEDISALFLDPGMPMKGRLLAKLSLLNRGPAVEGILLRYTLASKIAPIGQPQESVLAPPFLLESKRVPKVRANSLYDVVLDPSPGLKLYLKKSHRAGYWPEELRLQVMLEPRRGDKSRVQTLEIPLSLHPATPVAEAQK